MAAPIERLDVPLPVVEQQARTEAGCRAEQQHLLDPADTVFARLACEHDDCCSTESGDPEWDAWLARRIEDHKNARAAALAARNHTGGQA